MAHKKYFLESIKARVSLALQPIFETYDNWRELTSRHDDWGLCKSQIAFLIVVQHLRAVSGPGFYSVVL